MSIRKGEREETYGSVDSRVFKNIKIKYTT